MCGINTQNLECQRVGEVSATLAVTFLPLCVYPTYDVCVVTYQKLVQISVKLNPDETELRFTDSETPYRT